MRFYRVHSYDEKNGSFGFLWYTNRREAEKPGEPIEAVNIVPTKAGILRALQVYASHPDNG